MLIKLTSRQIISAWDALEKLIIDDDLPEAKFTSAVLEKLLIGSMQVWVAVEDDKFKAAILTLLQRNPVSNEKCLLVYHAHSVEPATSRDYVTYFVVLKRYAKKLKCTELIAYSKLPKLIDMWKKLGGTGEYTILNMLI